MSPVILFVDDEAALLEAIVRLLRKEPFTILTAASAAEALRVLARQPVDIVVSDEGMPGMSGSELLRRVRGEHPEVIRILLTGGAQIEKNARAIQEGEVYRFLSKPIEAQELARTLQQALRVRDLLQSHDRRFSMSPASRVRTG